jgi:hypothetical protein
MGMKHIIIIKAYQQQMAIILRKSHEPFLFFFLPFLFIHIIPYRIVHYLDDLSFIFLGVCLWEGLVIVSSLRTACSLF